MTVRRETPISFAMVELLPLALDYHSVARRLPHVARTYSRPGQVRRARPRAARGVHRPRHLRARDAAHPRDGMDLLRASLADPEERRLLHRADRPAADDHGEESRWRRRGALQPLPAPRQHDR